MINTLNLRYVCRTYKRVLNSFIRFHSSIGLKEVQNETPPHIPVLQKEVLQYIRPNEGKLFIDMTFGAGGHTKSFLQCSSNIKVICLDRDRTAYNFALKLSEEYPKNIIPLLGRFSELPALLKEKQIKQNSIDGILFDFGCSSMQFDIAERGFSISKDGPLDMRMDGTRFPENPTAAEVLANAEEEDLIKIFKIYGEEKNAKKVARAIIEARYTFQSLQTTSELAEFVAGVCDANYRKDKLQRNMHIATKIFQALRIFVNNELNEINYGLIIAYKYLKIGGRLVTLAFHSLEDTIVKRHLSGHVTDNVAEALPLKYRNYGVTYNEELIQEVTSSDWLSLTKHVVTPSKAEVELNPRSRSAKLRAAVKIK